MEMLLHCVFVPASGRCILQAREVGGAQGGKTPSAAAPLGTSDPVMCRLSPWTLLITTPETVVGQLLGSVSPSMPVDRCGRPTPAPCNAPTVLGDA
jgi:hypothetical protein